RLAGSKIRSGRLERQVDAPVDDGVRGLSAVLCAQSNPGQSGPGESSAGAHAAQAHGSGSPLRHDAPSREAPRSSTSGTAGPLPGNARRTGYTDWYRAGLAAEHLRAATAEGIAHPARELRLPANGPELHRADAYHGGLAGTKPDERLVGAATGYRVRSPS